MACRDILVVEDDDGIRETLADLLELQGYCVQTARNGLEGLTRFNEIGNPCLILLDLMMPVMNGWEFLETLKKQHQETFSRIPVTVVSAVADLDTVKAQYGCNVMKKPVDLGALINLAQQHCNETRTAS